MDASYFMEELISGKHYNCGYSDWYANNMITIHRIGSADNDLNYTIFSRNSIVDSECNRYNNINELIGDFEPYNDIRIVKCGYLIFADLKFKGIKQAISNLYKEFEDERRFKLSEECHTVCGSSLWVDGLTESFSYFCPSTNIEVDLSTIPCICKTNVIRKKGKKKCYPFDKTYNKEDGIFVSFIGTIDKACDVEYLKSEANKALQDLLAIVSKNCIYVEMEIKNPIFH